MNVIRKFNNIIKNSYIVFDNAIYDFSYKFSKRDFVRNNLIGPLRIIDGCLS